MQVARGEKASVVSPSQEPCDLRCQLARHDVPAGTIVAQLLQGQVTSSSFEAHSTRKNSCLILSIQLKAFGWGCLRY